MPAKPSFGMTRTKILRPVFAWHRPSTSIRRSPDCTPIHCLSLFTVNLPLLFTVNILQCVYTPCQLCAECHWYLLMPYTRVIFFLCQYVFHILLILLHVHVLRICEDFMYKNVKGQVKNNEANVLQNGPKVIYLWYISASLSPPVLMHGGLLCITFCH